MGTQQSGILKFKIADVIKDSDLLKLSRDKAYQILTLDSELANSKHQIIKRTLSILKHQFNTWNLIS